MLTCWICAFPGWIGDDSINKLSSVSAGAERGFVYKMAGNGDRKCDIESQMVLVRVFLFSQQNYPRGYV